MREKERDETETWRERQTDREKGEAEIWRLEGESEREKREKAYREERDETETFRGMEVQRECERHMEREGKRWDRNTGV